MTVAYPLEKDTLHPGFTSDRERNTAIRALQDRVGTREDDDPATLEDRLYTVECLLLSALIRLELPPGLIATKDKVK